MGTTSSGQERARNALRRLSSELTANEPLLPATLRFLRRSGERANVESVLEHWIARAAGTIVGPDRYRWELTHARGTGFPEYAGPPETWTAWHKSEQSYVERDVHAFEARLTIPLVLCESCELLQEYSSVDDRAAELMREAEPVLRRDFASYIQARHAWTDTFALWVLSRYPSTFECLHPIAVAIAETQAAIAHRSEGLVLGTRFPFHEQPIVSGCAHLGAALLHLGLHLDLVATTQQFVASAKRPSGGWGDSDDPEDLLTTLVAADLLYRSDPDYDPNPTRQFLVERQESNGLWKAMGPEAPWLTIAIDEWLSRADQPFADRFTWPHVRPANLDRKTGLPFFAHFADLAALLSSIEGLRQSSTQLAFIDLAGFREFNNQFGQQTGDDVLKEFAGLLASLPGVRAIRDGGDEFLVLGAPMRTGLEEDLERARMRWPEVFRSHFGIEVPPVAPRILVTTTSCADLMSTREALGRAVAPLKQRAPAPSPEGVMQTIELS